MERIAIGKNQQGALEDLLAGYGIHSFDYGLQGRAKTYSLKYRNSWLAFVKRLNAAGYRLRMEPGPRGGIGSATYFLDVSE